MGRLSPEHHGAGLETSGQQVADSVARPPRSRTPGLSESFASSREISDSSSLLSPVDARASSISALSPAASRSAASSFGWRSSPHPVNAADATIKPMTTMIAAGVTLGWTAARLLSSRTRPPIVSPPLPRAESTGRSIRKELHRTSLQPSTAEGRRRRAARGSASRSALTIDLTASHETSHESRGPLRTRAVRCVRRRCEIPDGTGFDGIRRTLCRRLVNSRSSVQFRPRAPPGQAPPSNTSTVMSPTVGLPFAVRTRFTVPPG